MPSTSSGATTTPAPVSRTSSAAAPSGGTTARIGRPAARYSKTFPERTPLPAPARVGHEQEQRLGVALEAERLRARARTGSARAGRPGRGDSAHSRSVVRKSPANRATTSRPESCSAWRNGRGSRFPKKLPACVIRKRGDGRVVEPREVVEVAAVRDRAHDAAGAERSHLLRDRLGDARDRVRAAGDEPREPLVRRLARARRGGVGAPMLVGDERVAEVGDPARSGRALGGGAHEMDRAGRRRRQDDVDPLPADDPDRGRDRGQVPAHARVRESSRRAVTCAWTSARSSPPAARSSSAGCRARGPR